MLSIRRRTVPLPALQSRLWKILLKSRSILLSKKMHSIQPWICVRMCVCVLCVGMQSFPVPTRETTRDSRNTEDDGRSKKGRKKEQRSRAAGINLVGHRSIAAPGKRWMESCLRILLPPAVVFQCHGMPRRVCVCVWTRRQRFTGVQRIHLGDHGNHHPHHGGCGIHPVHHGSQQQRDVQEQPRAGWPWCSGQCRW